MEDEIDEDSEPPLSTQRTLFSCGMRRLSDMAEEEINSSALVDIQSLAPAAASRRRLKSRERRAIPAHLYPPED
jgi:hypothetical protein